MKYTADELLSFLTTVCVVSGDFPPEWEAQYRAAISNSANARVEIREGVTSMLQMSGRWSHDTRVRIARALAAKQLPSLLDMMVALEHDEVALVRRRALKDEVDYAAAIDLLRDLTALTAKQRAKLDRLVAEYEQKIKRA